MVSTSSTNEDSSSTNEDNSSTGVVSTGSSNEGSASKHEGTSAGDARVLGDLLPEQVRVRMAPSPTGSPHVGLARTALYNWAFARHFGGTFVFRIEDTDKARNTVESYDSLIDLMQWLGLDWDEGPLKGGDFGPYRQSERSDLYVDVLAKLREHGSTYDCYCTNDDVDARRKASGSKVMGYDGF